MDDSFKKTNPAADGESKKASAAKHYAPKSVASQDSVLDGLFDIDKIYADFDRMGDELLGSIDSVFTTEKQQKIREEVQDRHAALLEAEKEATRRKYDEQLEIARQNTEQLFESTEEAQAEEFKPEPIHELDFSDLEYTEQEAEAKRKSEQAAADPDSQPGSASDFGKIIYGMIYALGLGIVNCVKNAAMFIFELFARPIRKLRAAAGFESKKRGRQLRLKIKAAVEELSVFKHEIKSTKKNIARIRRDPSRLAHAMRRYFKKAVDNHRQLFKTAFNLAVPVAAILLFVFVANFWSGVTFALEVTYNNKSIGYIGDESVYMEAQELIEDKLDTGAYSSEQTTADSGISASSLNAEYTLKLVSLEELNDAQTICDRVIENSVDNLTNACGIYVDGDFAGAVKNEADAKTVFYNILAPYEAEAREEGYVVGFAETIDYVQGLYSDSSDIILDAAQLAAVLDGDKTSLEEYSVESGDSLESLAEEYDIDKDRLVQLNGDVDWENLRVGDTVMLEASSKYVRIQKTVTSTDDVEVDFDTVKTKDLTKYSGYEKVTQKGVVGINRVTTTKIYIDGILADTTKETRVIREPVEEKKIVGGKSYSGGVSVGSKSSAGFLWPAPSCNYISSNYGYRRSGWHKGVDLCRSGGGANGTSVIASKAGTVEYAGYDSTGYGYMVLINHGGGYKTRYGHMLSGSITVSAGESVYAGEVIGRVGSTGNSTGPHLHFEVIYYGECQNPMNYI